MKSSTFIWICVCFMLVGGCHENGLADDDVDPAFLEEETSVINIVNRERSKAGLHSLQLNESLMKSAAIRAEELNTKFSHERPNGESAFSVIDRKDVPYQSAGENIAAGQSDSESVMNSWMNSEGHRKNILSENYTHIGVGYYESENKRYWVQLFVGM